MSTFIPNLVKRGAGLPATIIRVPPPSPFGPEVHPHRVGPAEEPAAGDIESPSPLQASFSEEHGQPSFEVPTHHPPSIQRLSGGESGTSAPFAGELVASAGVPALASQGRVTSERREVQATPPAPSNPADPTFQANRAVIIESDIEHNLHSPSPAQAIELGDERPRHASNVTVGPSPIIRTLEQVLAPMEPSIERSEDQAQPRESAPLAPTIRPALADSHTLLDFPRVLPASTPVLPAQLPIHVRIGRVEVRAATATAPTPAPASPSPPAPLGFDGYYRVRTYRN